MLVELVKSGGAILEVFERTFCYSLQCNPYTEFVTHLFEKKLFESQGKDLFQNLAKKTRLSVHGGNNRKNLNVEYKCVTGTWMRQKLDDSVKKWFTIKNSKLKFLSRTVTDDYGKT